MTKNALVLMAAVVPTTGHADLIDFAANLPDTQVWVQINGRTHEPVPLRLRYDAVARYCEKHPNVEVIARINDTAPQQPHLHNAGVEDFWQWWVKEVNDITPQVNGEWDYVVASEGYAKTMADYLGAQFIPYDMERSINNARGTVVRSDMKTYWNHIMPEFRRHVMVNAVIFGQESTGKTTVSKHLSEMLNVPWYVEFARPYLEQLEDKTCTLDVMSVIESGQKALQDTVMDRGSHYVNIFDTDLFSTAGYYLIMGEKERAHQCALTALDSPMTMYYVMPDDIPFEQDPIRYGGTVRESERSLWTDLLETYHVPYRLVPSGSAEEKAQWIAADIAHHWNNVTAPVVAFEREL